MKNIASKMLRGSKNIDRMREEVDRMVSILAGFIKRSERESESIHFHIRHRGWFNWFGAGDAEHRWVVRGDVVLDNPDQCEIGVDYQIDNPGSHNMHSLTPYEPEVLYSNLSGARVINLHRIQLVHHGLDVLVRGVAKEFGYRATYRPFLKASKVF